MGGSLLRRVASVSSDSAFKLSDERRASSLRVEKFEDLAVDLVRFEPRHVVARTGDDHPLDPRGDPGEASWAG